MTLNRITKSLFVIFSPVVLAACGGDSSGSPSNNVSNALPIFSASQFVVSGNEDQPITTSVVATDSDADPLTYSVAVNANHGLASISAEGEVSYQPDANFYGSDEITVKVSDGKGSATAVVVFELAAVNDAPVLGTSQVVVSSDGQSSGQIFASDVDGDALTYSVVLAPEQGDLSVNSQTGEFTYLPETLQSIQGSFRVRVSDGTTFVEGDIALSPSFVTNQDKLSYYYASAQSHLKQAEGYLASVDDDLTKGDLSISIAKGYVDAGFYQQGIAFIENNVYTADDEAQAYRLLALSFDAVQKPEFALQMREKSIAAFNFYLAEKGIQNISSADASFLMDLVFDYLDAAQNDQAEALLSTIRIYAEAVRSEEYDRVYGRFLTAFTFAAQARVLEYLNNPTPTSQQIASTAIGNMFALADKTGYQNASGSHAGERVYKVKALYSSWAAELFTFINDEDGAKMALAKALSLYMPVSYDDNYVFSVDAHAQVLSETYSFPLVTLAGTFSRYYPQLENLAYALIPETSFHRGSAKQYIHTYSVVSQVIAGVSVADALAPVEAEFRAEGGLNDYLRMLVEYADDEPRIARLLYLAGYENEAQQVADAAVNLVSDENYIVNSYLPQITGNRGCYRFSQLYSAMQLNTDVLYSRCASISTNFFQGDRTDIATDDVIEGNRHLLQMFLDAGQHSIWPEIEQTLVKTVAMVSDTDSRHEYELLVASALASSASTLAQAGDVAGANQAYALAVQWMLKTLNEVNQRLSADDVSADEIDDIISLVGILVASETGVYNERYRLMQVSHAVRMGAGRFSDYPATIATVNSALVQTLKNIVNATQHHADNIQQKHMRDLVGFAASLRDYALAEQLIASPANAEADKLALTATLVEFLANRDDFPATAVATVDTDQDGLVNFFSHAASAENIGLSGLLADDDSDNDGTGDQEDLTPIGG